MAKKDNEFKEFIDGLLSEQRERFLAELNLLEGKAYVDRYLSLIEYVQPKLSRQEIDQQVDIPVTINLVAGKQQRPLEIEGETIEEA